MQSDKVELGCPPKPTQAVSLFLGEMSMQVNIKPVRALVEAFRVAVDHGAW